MKQLANELDEITTTGSYTDEEGSSNEVYAVFQGIEPDNGERRTYIAHDKIEFHEWIKNNELLEVMWSVKPLSVGKIIRANELKRKVRNCTATPEEIEEYNGIEN